MYLPTNMELRQQRKAILDECASLVSGPMSSERRAFFDRRMAEAEELKTRIYRIEGQNNSMGEFRGGAIGGEFRDGAIRGGAAESRRVREESAEFRQAFGRYLRIGMNELGAEERALIQERRDMGTGGQGAYPGATSGFFVPVGFVDRVEDAMKYYGPMLKGGADMPEIMDTATGAPLPYPAADDTSQVGEQVDENAIVGSQDVNLQQIMFGAFKYSSKLVKVSIELLQDSAFDIEMFLTNEFGRRLGRIVNTKLTTGVGTTEPKGIVTAVSAGGNKVAAVGSSTNTGGTEGNNTIGSDDLTNLEHAVDPVYRPGARYMMHDSTLKSLKKVKDKYGRPLWQESTRDGQPATINGYQYLVNNDMDELPAVPTSPPLLAETVLFGAMPKYVVRRVKQMAVLRLSERYAEYGQVGFLAFARYDGQSIDIGHRAFALLTNT